MPFFKNSNASKTSFLSTSSSTPLQPRVVSVFDSTSPTSPLFTPDYQVPVHSLADSVSILRENPHFHKKSEKVPYLKKLLFKTNEGRPLKSAFD